MSGVLQELRHGSALIMLIIITKDFESDLVRYQIRPNSKIWQQL